MSARPLPVTGGPRIVDRYTIHDAIGVGGMATVYLGRFAGPDGDRTVAIKRLRDPFATDPEFVASFLDEARLAARIHHPNVVATLDVVADRDEVLLAMEYVPGEPLSCVFETLAARRQRMPWSILVAILSATLHGLHAAHEATAENGDRLMIVHRDVSPHNILVGADGVSRVLDFGIAVAATPRRTTQVGELKGKVSYMAPEQLALGEVDRRVDVYAAGAVLWEGLVGARLFAGGTDFQIAMRISRGEVTSPALFVRDLPRALEAVVLRALAPVPEERFASAREFALALSEALPPAHPAEVSEWLHELAGEALDFRAGRVREIERSSPSKTVSAPVLGPTEAPVARSVPTTQRSSRWVGAATMFAIGLAVCAGVAVGRRDASRRGAGSAIPLLRREYAPVAPRGPKVEKADDGAPVDAGSPSRKAMGHDRSSKP